MLLFVGDYCLETGLNATSGPCDEGYYCPPGQNVSNPAGYECFEGHYCPSGQGWPLECPFGNFTNTTGQSECTICQEGWWVADLTWRFVNLFVDVFVVTRCCLWLIWQLWKARGKCLNNVLVFFWRIGAVCFQLWTISFVRPPLLYNASPLCKRVNNCTLLSFQRYWHAIFFLFVKTRMLFLFVVDCLHILWTLVQ